MYIFDGLTASAAIRTQAEIDSVIRQLAKNDAYQPVLRSAGRELLRLTGAKSRTSQESNLLLGVLGDARLATHSADAPMLGELFLIEGSALIVQPLKSRLAIGEVRGHEKEAKLSEFAEDLGRAAKAALDGRRLRGMSFEWTPMTQDWLRVNSGYYGPRNPSVSPRSIRNRSELKTKPASLTVDDIEDAKLLVRPEQRLFLQRLIQLGKARSVDARQDVTPETVEPLLARGLVNKEFLVVCRKDSSTLCTAQSKEEIEGVKFRCSNCGRAFSDEHVQEIYAPAARSRELTNGSHWMTLWITDLLLAAGVEISQISWGATAGEDELDIVAKVNGVTVFFELKDREFGLGDAYPFSSRVQRYGGDFGVILSMDRVAEEVVKYLNEQRGPKIFTLAGVGKIESDLPNVLQGIATNAALYSVSMLSARSRVDVKPLLREWMRDRARAALPFSVPIL